MSLPINQIICGDCLEVMKGFPDESIDCVVTDPPYGIGFMGKEWDKALPPKEAFREIYRVLKSGALAFVMSSPRQDVLWRMLAMLEECGFELQQSFVSWIYKSGFPKAYDLSLGIDKKFILEEFVAQFGRKPTKEEMKQLLKEKRKESNQLSSAPNAKVGGYKGERYKEKRETRFGTVQDQPTISLPASDLAKKWQGWKSITGLKPALECILMVNKPMSEQTIVDNVLKHGTGAINVDACRIPFKSKEDEKQRMKDDMGSRPNKGQSYGRMGRGYDSGHKQPLPSFRVEGRFPANLLVSDKASDCFKYFDLDAWAEHHGFLDVPKASKKERDTGGDGTKSTKRTKARNIHPTVKPVKLMVYLITLACPPNGIVLDPFVGTGSTCIASQQLGRKWIGIDINPEFVEIAQHRLTQCSQKLTQFFGEKKEVDYHG